MTKSAEARVSVMRQFSSLDPSFLLFVVQQHCADQLKHGWKTYLMLALFGSLGLNTGEYALGAGFLVASEDGFSLRPIVTGGMAGRCLSLDDPGLYAPGPGVFSGRCVWRR